MVWKKNDEYVKWVFEGTVDEFAVDESLVVRESRKRKQVDYVALDKYLRDKEAALTAGGDEQAGKKAKPDKVTADPTKEVLVLSEADISKINTKLSYTPETKLEVVHIKNMLAQLQRCEMTLDLLRKTKIGKAVNLLKKHPSVLALPEGDEHRRIVEERVTKLVNVWKSLVAK